MVSSITRTQSGINGHSATDADGLNEGIENHFGLGLIALPTTPLFGTDGIRGRVGDLLSAPLAMRVGFWAGIVLQSHAAEVGPIILGQDSRNSSDMLAMALSAGLTAAGLEVWYLGLCPTPCVAYLTSASDAIGGVMISASHNPPEDNGIKIFGADGAKLSKTLQAAIEAGLRGETSVPGGVNNCGRYYFRPELINEYTAALKQPLQSQGINFQGMKIVLDLAWGAAVGVAPSVFTDMGAEVIALHNQADGNRINVNCGSTHLGILRDAVISNNADFGVGFDGDADRALAVDNTGAIVDGDYILYLWGRHLLQQQQLPDNLIVTTVMANLGFERAWKKLGGQMIRTNVGDQYVQAEMSQTGGMLGGEQSGHILCRHYGITGDGLLTALHLATVVKHSGTSLGDMLSQSFQTYPQLLRNVRVEDRTKRMGWKDCQPIQIAIARAEEAMGDAGRVLVRASGTEPVIRVMVEAEDAQMVEHWTTELVSVVEQHLG